MSGSHFRVLITGGAGFVGQHLIAALQRSLPAGSSIISADRHMRPLLEGIRGIHLDLTESAAVASAIREEQPTHVVHLAAISSVAQANADVRRAWAVNFGGTFNLLLSIAESAPETRIIFCSSSEVYGATSRQGGRLDEAAVLAPENSYGSTKAAAELLLCQMARQGLRALIFRPFNHTGPGQSESFVVPAFAAQIARIMVGLQAPRIEVGNLNVQRDFLDVRDVVDAYVAATLNFDQLPNSSILNLASGTPRRIGDILDSLLEHSAIGVELVPDPTRLRSDEVPTIAGDAALAHALLGWAPHRPWNQTLLSTLDYWRRLV